MGRLDCLRAQTMAAREGAVRLAIIGTRGVPARYGGFETMAAELSRELAARNHDVTVYCRRGRVDDLPPPAGVHQRFVPMVPTKYLETVSHTSVSVLDAMTRRFDAILMVNAANAVFAFVPRIFGVPVALNVDGIERRRAKWGIAGRAWYRVSERLATIAPHAVVTDADVIEAYYRVRYRKPTTMIPYGAALLARNPAPDLSRFGVEPDGYLLYVSRLEPENNADLVIRAYRQVSGDVPLLIVGDAPYAAAYRQRVKELAAHDPRVRLLGGVYGDGYRDLQRGARAYVQATEVGGTHPALIEAMGAGNVVLAYGTPENREVVGDTALLFGDEDDLAAGMRRVVADPRSEELGDLATRARERAEARYSWSAVTDQYEELFARLVRDRR
jgi:glycosyltransferase involved in cell wall biosynthesis